MGQETNQLQASAKANASQNLKANPFAAGAARLKKGV
jgi:hypothetical protein